ncbi:hypothetical protein LSAT2_003427, partial [Lamellibrachia satsuma]
ACWTASFVDRRQLSQADQSDEYELCSDHLSTRGAHVNCAAIISRPGELTSTVLRTS